MYHKLEHLSISLNKSLTYFANYQVEECEVEVNETALIGNGFCNDITNVRSCGFDGGDCCGENISTEFCEICTCHLDDLPNYDPWGLT